MSDWPGVFVSSTCYDLIDLRAELEIWIRDLGLIPVMSDRPTSEFDPGGYRDSITTCVENVRKCPTFVCILSNRYGPRLGKAGFEDISATHIEYKAALAADRRIIFYARDRLLGDLQVWRNATRANVAVPKLPWVDADQYGIFELLSEHMQLSPGDDPNWVWPFRDSAELRQRLALDLGEESRRHRLTRLIEQRMLPCLRFSEISKHVVQQKQTVKLECRNVGAPALDVSLSIDGTTFQDFARAVEAGAGLRHQSDISFQPGKQPTRLLLRYSIQEGYMIEERLSWATTIRRDSIRLLDSPSFRIE